MAGPEILFGVAGIFTPLLAAPVGSAIHKRFHKPRYDYYSDRDEACNHFIESWTTLNDNVLRLLSIIPTLAHDDQVRRAVLKELVRATKVFQDANSHLLACKPIGNALKEKEKTELFLEAVGKRMGETGMMADEKMAAMFGSIVAAKLSSPSLNSPNRERNMETMANRNPQTIVHGNPKFQDEGFFEHPQSPRPLGTASPRSGGTQNSKHVRNTASHYDCEGSKPHHHKKCHHGSSSSRSCSSHSCSSRSSSSSFPSFHISGCSHGSSPRREKRYHDRDDEW